MPRSRPKIDRIAAAIAKGDLSMWGDPEHVLELVRVVPTIYPGLDRALRVWGWPLRRVGLLHGPEQQGKTAFLLGLGLSFLRRGFLFGLIDAEQTTPFDWVRRMYGQLARRPGFRAMRPSSYEEAVNGLRQFAAFARSLGLPGLVGIDSIRKLMPEVLRTRIEGAKGGKGIDGYGGRAAQLKANYNAQWLDEIVPLINDGDLSIVFITRESENADAGMYDPTFRITGGRALLFEAGIRCRILKAGVVRATSDKSSPVVANRMRVETHKTKLAGKGRDKVVKAYFHVSTGELVAEGFDRARDLILEGAEVGVLTRTGGGAVRWGKRRWRTTNRAVRALTGDEAMLEALDADVRAQHATLASGSKVASSIIVEAAS